MIRLRFASPTLTAALAVLTLSCSDDGLAGAPANEGGEGTTGGVATGSSGQGSGDLADDVGPFDGSTAAAETTAGEGGEAETIEVSGDAVAFALPGTPYGLIDGATISILEQPEQAAQTDAMGHYVFPAVPAGSEATLVIEAEGWASRSRAPRRSRSPSREPWSG